MKAANYTRKKLNDAIVDIDRFLRQKVNNEQISESKFNRIKDNIFIFIDTLVESITDIEEGSETEAFFDDVLDEDDVLELIEIYDDAA